MSTESRVVEHRLLMCAPDAYDLKYEINAWMNLSNRPDVSLAAAQWTELYRVLTEEIGAAVSLIPQAANAPDMVFTANAGLVQDMQPMQRRVLLAQFRHPERQVEVTPFRTWFEAAGYETVTPPGDCKFEGEGDALWCGETLVAGYLKRSDICAHRWLGEMLQTSVLSLELTDDRWYHLDTAFFSPAPNLAVYYPGAFDPYAVQVLESTFETLTVVEEEALHFACNAVVLGQDIVIPAGCPRLKRDLEERGYRVHAVALSEFIKSGGAAKCLTLHLK